MDDGPAAFGEADSVGDSAGDPGEAFELGGEPARGAADDPLSPSGLVAMASSFTQLVSGVLHNLNLKFWKVHSQLYRSQHFELSAQF